MQMALIFFPILGFGESLQFGLSPATFIDLLGLIVDLFQSKIPSLLQVYSGIFPHIRCVPWVWHGD
jgi:hypothetical protein